MDLINISYFSITSSLILFSIHILLMIVFNKKFSKWYKLYKDIYLDKVDETEQYESYFKEHVNNIVGYKPNDIVNVKENKILSFITKISLRYVAFNYIENSLSKNRHIVKNEPLLHEFKPLLFLFILEALSLKISTLLFQFSLVYTLILMALNFIGIA